jgi:hypothetical protein
MHQGVNPDCGDHQSADKVTFGRETHDVFSEALGARDRFEEVRCAPCGTLTLHRVYGSTAPVPHTVGRLIACLPLLDEIHVLVVPQVEELLG